MEAREHWAEKAAKENRFLCWPDTPWVGEARQTHNGRAMHPLAKSAGTCSDGCCDKYKCPVCNHTWLEEVAQ